MDHSIQTTESNMFRETAARPYLMLWVRFGMFER